MKKKLVTMALLATTCVAVNSSAGGSNSFSLTSDYGDGWLRVQKVGSGVTFGNYRMPKLTGVAQCRADGYRVMKIGPKDTKPYTQTQVKASWTLKPSSLFLAGAPVSARKSREAAFAAACEAKHSAVDISVRQAGLCLCNNSAFCGGNIEVKQSTRTLSFGLECTGYGNPDKRPLYLFKHYGTVAGKKQPMWHMLPVTGKSLAVRESKGDVRAGIEGQVWIYSKGNERRALWELEKTSDGVVRRTIASHPTTIQNLVAKGYKKLAVVGQIDKNPGPGRIPLYSYFLWQTQDPATVATKRSIDGLKSRGYKLVRTEGYVLPLPRL